MLCAFTLQLFHFVPNLKPYTWHRGRGNRRFGAYLLSVDYLRAHERLAARAVAENRHLCADNGNVGLIRGLLKRFKVPALELDRLRKAEEKRLKRYARPGELSRGLTSSYRELARGLRAASKAALSEGRIAAVVAQQETMGATYAIGMEDFTVATMTGLSLEREYSDLTMRFYRPLIERAVRFAVDTKTGRYGALGAEVFAGLHALDYDTAFLAGRLAAEAGLSSIATGLVGALRDRNYVDYRIEGGQLVELERAVPRPYLRVMEVAAGLHCGYHSVTGRRPGFHALGVGSPVLLPMLSLLGDRRTFTAADSTSPIVDGWSSPTISLYVDSPAPLKYKAFRIADYWIRGGRGWDCQCPYCRRFLDRHPPDIAGARRWWRRQGQPKITKRMLERSGPLVGFLPLLGHHPELELRTRAAMARVGHNHWVLQRLERKAQSFKTPAARYAWVKSLIDGYGVSAASERWKAAVVEAWVVTDAAYAKLRA